MILVTLGTIPYPFDRAILWLEILLEEKVIDEPVFCQHGITDVSRLLRFSAVTCKPIVDSDYLIELIDRSRLAISHAGQGSAQMLAKRSTSFVLLPRLSRFGEHVDDHQLQFAHCLEEMGVYYASTLDDLKEYIVNPPPPFKKRLFNTPRLSEHLLKTYPA
jgi:UDP-N-acetylglucosamine transferase subunit ALG13